MSDLGVGLAPVPVDTIGRDLGHWVCCHEPDDSETFHTLCGLLIQGPVTATDDADDPGPGCVVCVDLHRAQFCPLGHRCDQ